MSTKFIGEIATEWRERLYSVAQIVSFLVLVSILTAVYLVVEAIGGSFYARIACFAVVVVMVLFEIVREGYDGW